VKNDKEAIGVNSRSPSAIYHDSTRDAFAASPDLPHHPGRSDQVARRVAKASRGGRPPAFDPQPYRHRNVVERCFNRLKQWCDLATHFAKRAAIYRASLLPIAAVIWLS
jgi:transposase